MKPPFPYFGGKQRAATKIIEALPPHELYVEPFAGSLSVLLAKSPVKREVVNDLDGDLVTFWRVLRDRPEELAVACELTPHSRAEQRLKVADSVDDVERARLVWLKLTQGRAGTLLSTGWKQSLNSSASMPRYLQGYRERLLPAAERIRNVSLECLPALDVIALYDRPEAVLYVDPPYLSSTRNSKGYAEEMGARADHVELLDVLKSARSRVALSGYSSPLYERELDNWTRREWAATSGEGARVEILWMNY